MQRNNKDSTPDNELDRETPTNKLDWSYQQDPDHSPVNSDFQSPSSKPCNITRWGHTVAKTADNKPISSTPKKGGICQKLNFDYDASPDASPINSPIKDTSTLKEKTLKATKTQSSSSKPNTTKETGYAFWLKLLGVILFTLGLGYLLYPTTLVILSSIGVKSAQLAQSATCSINTFRHSSSITRAFTSSLASSC